MKLFMLLVVLVLVAGGAYVLMNIEKTGQQMEESPVDPNIEAKLPPRIQEAPKKEVSGSERVVCPLCNGECRILRIQKGGGFHRENGITCPLCLGSGSGRAAPASRSQLCPNCYGMGFKVRIKQPYVTMAQISRQGGTESYFASNPRVVAVSVPPRKSKYRGGAGEYVRYSCGRCNKLGSIRRTTN